jgi:hypothetical protein
MHATPAAEQGKQGSQQQNEQNAPEAKLLLAESFRIAYIYMYIYSQAKLLPAESFRIALAPGD